MQHRHLNRTSAGHCRHVRLLEPVPVFGPRAEVVAELADACADIDADDEARVVVLEFAGAALQPGDRIAPNAQYEDAAGIVERIARIPLPVIAAIAGDAYGFALELALACDLRIGVAGARFALPQVHGGRIPSAGGTQRLPRLIGRGKALEMILTGAPIGADEASSHGLLHQVSPPAELGKRALALAGGMASASPVAMRYAKEALYAGLDLTLDQGMRMELDLYLLLFSTHDREEGINAFRQKRDPRFTGS